MKGGGGRATAHLFWPRPLGPWGGAKHIRRDFDLAPLVMPQGWDLGVPWGGWGQFFSEIQPDLVCELFT